MAKYVVELCLNGYLLLTPKHHDELLHEGSVRNEISCRSLLKHIICHSPACVLPDFIHLALGQREQPIQEFVAHEVVSVLFFLSKNVADYPNSIILNLGFFML